MVYTVKKSTGLNSDREYRAYVDLLEEVGVDLAKAPRIPEPGTSRRWLYVWQERPYAERFARELNRRLRDHAWEVHEFDTPAPEYGALAPLVIWAFDTSSGRRVFELERASHERIFAHFPNARTRGSVDFDVNESTAECETPERVWRDVVLPLTGLTADEIETLGGVQVVDHEEGAEIFARIPGVPA